MFVVSIVEGTTTVANQEAKWPNNSRLFILSQRASHSVSSSVSPELNSKVSPGSSSSNICLCSFVSNRRRTTVCEERAEKEFQAVSCALEFIKHSICVGSNNIIRIEDYYYGGLPVEFKTSNSKVSQSFNHIPHMFPAQVALPSNSIRFHAQPCWTSTSRTTRPFGFSSLSVKVEKSNAFIMWNVRKRVYFYTMM